MQQGLTALGYDVPATGYYGTMTRRAVAALQSEFGLPATGRADGPTIQAIKDYLAELGTPPAGDDESGFFPYGAGSGAYSSPRSPYPSGPDSPYNSGTYGWGTPIGPGMMGGMMGGGWSPRGSWGSGPAGRGWGGSPFGW